MPELDLHTISDQLVPVQQENYYARTVRRAGERSLLRQAFVGRQEHCNFTSAELVAGVLALQQRMRQRQLGLMLPRPLVSRRPRRVSASATPRSFTYWPEPLSGDNGPFNPFTQGVG